MGWTLCCRMVSCVHSNHLRVLMMIITLGNHIYIYFLHYHVCKKLQITQNHSLLQRQKLTCVTRVTLALVFFNKIDTSSIVLTLIFYAVINVNFTPIPFKAWWAMAAERRYKYPSLLWWLTCNISITNDNEIPFPNIWNIKYLNFNDKENIFSV